MRNTLNDGLFFFGSIVIDGDDNSRIRVENIAVIVQGLGYAGGVSQHPTCISPPCEEDKVDFGQELCHPFYCSHDYTD